MMLCTLSFCLNCVHAECPIWMLTHNSPGTHINSYNFLFTSSLSFTPAYRRCLTLMLTATSYVRFSTHTQSAGVFWHMAIPAKSNLTHLSGSVSTFLLQSWEKRAVTTCMHCRPPQTQLWDGIGQNWATASSSPAQNLGSFPHWQCDSLCSLFHKYLHIIYKYFIPKDW